MKSSNKYINTCIDKLIDRREELKAMKQTPMDDIQREKIDEEISSLSRWISGLYDLIEILEGDYPGVHRS